MILAVWRWIQLVLLSNLMLLAILLAGRTPLPTVLQIAKLVVVETTLSVVCWAVFQMYIRPHRIQQSVDRRG
jgi:hypothetical protein